MEELVEGEVLADRYLLGPVVGRGAMGEVRLAEDVRLERPVAIKSLRPELARHPDVRRRFGHEARAAARISHPNVVRVYDSGERGGIPYLVMECLPGSTLVDELAWGPLEPRRARSVGLDVLGALAAAHRLGIVHRDVKPGNILLSAALDGPVKVSDFGIAKSAADHSLTESGALVGTAAYLAPERVAGEPAGPATDLFSVGVVLYEALAGRKPYQGDTSLAIALAIHMGGAPSLLELRPDLDPALVEIVEKAIARDPADRWSSAAEMGAALAGWRPAEGPPPAFSTPAAAPTDAPTVRLDPPTKAGSTVPLVAAASAAGAAGARPINREVEPTLVAPAAAGAGSDGPDHPPRSPWRDRRALLAVGAAGALLLVLVLAMASRGDGRRPDRTVTPSTSAEVVVGTGPSLSSPPVEETVAPSPTIAPTTTRLPRPAAVPATTAPPPTTAPPTTSAPVTTATTKPAVTTTRPPATAVPTTATPTAPPTTAAAGSV